MDKYDECVEDSDVDCEMWDMWEDRRRLAGFSDAAAVVNGTTGSDKLTALTFGNTRLETASDVFDADLRLRVKNSIKDLFIHIFPEPAEAAPSRGRRLMSCGEAHDVLAENIQHDYYQDGQSTTTDCFYSYEGNYNKENDIIFVNSCGECYEAAKKLIESSSCDTPCVANTKCGDIMYEFHARCSNSWSGGEGGVSYGGESYCGMSAQDLCTGEESVGSTLEDFHDATRQVSALVASSGLATIGGMIPLLVGGIAKAKGLEKLSTGCGGVGLATGIIVSVCGSAVLTVIPMLMASVIYAICEDWEDTWAAQWEDVSDGCEVSCADAHEETVHALCKVGHGTGIAVIMCWIGCIAAIVTMVLTCVGFCNAKKEKTNVQPQVSQQYIVQQPEMQVVQMVPAGQQMVVQQPVQPMVVQAYAVPAPDK